MSTSNSWAYWDDLDQDPLEPVPSRTDAANGTLALHRSDNRRDEPVTEPAGS